MRRVLPLPILLLSAYSVCSQPTSVRLSAQQAQKIADSLAVLPLVRREAAAWQQASQANATAADSLGRAATAYQQALQAQQRACDGQQQLLTSESARAALWRRRARRRGLLNWLGLGLLGGIGYLLLGK